MDEEKKEEFVHEEKKPEPKKEAEVRAGRRKDQQDQVIIRPYPKVVFFYPTLAMSFLCGILGSIFQPETLPERSLGLIFIVVFFLNLLVISFEFTRIKSIAIFIGLIALLLLLLYLNTIWAVFGFLGDVLRGLTPEANPTFFFLVALFYSLIFVVVFINTRFNYYIIKHNEVLHRHGFLGDVERYPSPHLRMTKEINDILEFILLASGRIVLYPAQERKAVVLDNVIGVNKVEKKVRDLLETVSVSLDPQSPSIV